MKAHVPSLIAAALFLPTALLAQETGTSHPEAIEAVITTEPAAPAQTAKPSAATPMLQPRAEATPLIAEVKPVPESIATPPAETPRPTLTTRVEVTAEDPADAGIVTTYPFLKNALAEGTLIRARLNEQLSSKVATAGSRFTAHLTTDITHDGKVVLPEGAILSGRITAVRGAHHFGNAASMHLEPDTITLPDGTAYRMNARVIDTDDSRNQRVNGEGTIIRSDHAKATLTALSLTTGSAAAAGAVLGGGVGAVVGAGIGAGIGTVWWFRRDRNETIAEGTQLIFSLDRPLVLTPLAAK